MKKLLSMMLAFAMLISTTSSFSLPISAEGLEENASEAVTTVSEESPALPEVTIVPEVTTVPEETTIPDETTTPEETAIPETTPAPEETSEPSSEVTEPATEGTDPVAEGTDPASEVTEPAPGVIEPLPEDELLSAALPLAEGDGIIASGYCGDTENGALDGTNLTWTLDSEGTLTISGNGDMGNYYYSDMPYCQYKDMIKFVVLTPGVTSIGRSAFAEHTYLISVIIPDSVTSIRDGAFNGCSSLENITIPSNVTSIGNYTFSNCQNLLTINVDPQNMYYHMAGNCLIENETKGIVKGFADSVIPNDGSVVWILDGAFTALPDLVSLIIPEGITKISTDAFYNCPNVKSIHLPSSVNWLDWKTGHAFSTLPNLEEITVDPANEVYLSSGNCLIDKKYKSLEFGCKASVIPDDGSVTSIESYAFDGCIGLKSIVIPKSINSIGDYAFDECSSLTSITMQNGVTSIGNGAFRSSGITSITIPNSVTSIGSGAFDHTRLVSAFIPSSVISVGEAAFSNNNMASLRLYCESDTKPEGWDDNWFRNENTTVQWGFKGSLSDEVASGYCGGEGDGTNLTWSLSGDGTLTITGTGKMCDCIEISQQYMEPNAPWENFIRSISNVIIDEGVSSIGIYAFSNCDNLTSISIPNSVTSIGEYAFAGCRMTSIIIPDSVTSISDGAFQGCRSLASITIPNSVTSIGSAAFSGCESLANVTIPNSVTSIGDGAFSGCQSVEVALGNKYYHMDGNCLIETGTGKLIAGFSNSVIPTDGSVTSIGNMAFAGCEDLVSMIIPRSVTSIGDYAFSGCRNLSSIIIPDSVTSISYGVFRGCQSLASITIPSSIASIGAGAFSGCQSVEVAAGNRNYHMDGNCLIETGTGRLINGFNNSVIPNDGSVTSIGDRAFEYCNDLTSIVIPNGVKLIGNTAFAGCQSMESIIIPDSVMSIGFSAFSNCKSLESIIIPNSVKTIGTGAFSDSGLTSITIPKSVISIGEQAFSYCPNLTTIYCEVKSKPSGWADSWYDKQNWNGEKVTVSWGNAEVVDYIPGDFNEDGVVDMKDAAHFIGWVGAPFLPQFQINQDFNADFNKDGTIDMKDAAYYIGWVGAPFLPQFKIDW